MDPKVFPFWTLVGEHGFFKAHPQETLKPENVIVCWTCASPRDPTTLIRRFGGFASPESFEAWYQRVPQVKRNGYEVIWGHQKPHFDIDISSPDVDGEKILQALLQGIETVLGRLSVQWQPQSALAVYTSHGTTSKGTMKQSYHVVLPTYMHASSEEAKAFAYAAIAEMPADLQPYVDKGVYSPTQQFRLLGSTKLGDQRHKSATAVVYKGTSVPATTSLAASLVRHTAGCTTLPALPTSPALWTVQAAPEVAYSDAHAAFALLAYETWCKEDGVPFAFDKAEQSFVYLRRLRPSTCPVCERVHEHDNAFLYIHPEGHVYYYCRRNTDKRRTYVGHIQLSTD